MVRIANLFRAALLALPLLVMATGPMPARADALDDRLAAARATWLAGDDQTSLPALAQLAREGHVPAQVLLGRIETNDRGPSPWRLALASKDRRAIFRSKARSSFGKSWIAVAAEKGDLRALLFHASRLPLSQPRLIAELFAAGEPQASDHATRVVALRGSDADRAALLADGPLLDELRPYVAYLAGAPEPGGDGLAALRHITANPAIAADDPGVRGIAGLLALGWGFGEVSPDNPWFWPVAEWLMSAEPTRPIAGLCRTACPEEAAACGMAVLALSGGYYEAIRLDSPAETIIPQAEFLASPRARLMALRRAALARAETNAILATPEEIATVSACAARLIAAERAKY